MARKREEDYNAEDLGIITRKAMDELNREFNPIIMYIIMCIIKSCIAAAKEGQLACKVPVDLGGREAGKEKAERISDILIGRGFNVKWQMGEGFQSGVHQFMIGWKLPENGNPDIA